MLPKCTSQLTALVAGICHHGADRRKEQTQAGEQPCAGFLVWHVGRLYPTGDRQPQRVHEDVPLPASNQFVGAPTGLFAARAGSNDTRCPMVGSNRVADATGSLCAADRTQRRAHRAGSSCAVDRRALPAEAAAPRLPTAPRSDPCRNRSCRRSSSWSSELTSRTDRTSLTPSEEVVVLQSPHLSGNG